MRFDVERFVADLGGPAAAATFCGVSRTTPYRWLKTGKVSTAILERVKAQRSDFAVDTYFVMEAA